MFFFKFLDTHTSAKSSRDTRKHPKKHPKKNGIPKERIQPGKQNIQKVRDNLDPNF